MEIIAIFWDRLVESILIFVLKHVLLTETLTVEKEYKIHSVRDSLIL